MKRILTLALTTLLLFALVACGGNGNGENGAETQDAGVRPDGSGIVGAWAYVESTEGDAETPTTIAEFEIIPPVMHILDDDWVTIAFWDNFQEGMLVNTADNTYTITNMSASSPAETWAPADVLLSYDPGSGRLRYTAPGMDGAADLHHYFVRD